MGYPRCRLRAVGLFSLIAIFISFLFTGVRSASAGYARLVWTSPGDTGGLMQRVSYLDLRISTRAITGTDTLSWWNAATKISMAGKLPSLPGSPDSILLGSLINSVRYYAIIRSASSTYSWSSFSNVATFTPSATITAVLAGGDVPPVVLGAPRPTPTSGRTQVSLDLPQTMPVQASVFDAQGRRVRTIEQGTLEAGTHVLRWDGSLDGGGDAASGVYWIRVAAGPIQKEVKLVVVR